MATITEKASCSFRLLPPVPSWHLRLVLLNYGETGHALELDMGSNSHAHWRNIRPLPGLVLRENKSYCFLISIGVAVDQLRNRMLQDT